MSKPTIYILNTTILTTPGLTYDSHVIGVTEARSMLGLVVSPSDYETDKAAGLTPIHVTTVGERPRIVSAVGHQATADIASTVLGMAVALNREPANMQAGDKAICIKLRGRPPEGTILSREQVEAIGYDLVLLEARDPAQRRAAIRLLEDCASLLCHADDAAAVELEQTPGSRRKGNAPMQVHFIVRRPLVHGGGYVEVTQDWGTDDWAIRELTADEARNSYAAIQTIRS